jgi:hypothetical protein
VSNCVGGGLLSKAGGEVVVELHWWWWWVVEQGAQRGKQAGGAYLLLSEAGGGQLLNCIGGCRIALVGGGLLSEARSRVNRRMGFMSQWRGTREGVRTFLGE